MNTKFTATEEELHELGLEPLEIKRMPKAGADTAPTTRPIATDYVHTVHPDTGLDVVFVPGEALPEWAIAPPPEPTPVQEPEAEYKNLDASSLKEIVKERGITPTGRTRQDLVDALVADDQSKPTA